MCGLYGFGLFQHVVIEVMIGEGKSREQPEALLLYSNSGGAIVP